MRAHARVCVCVYIIFFLGKIMCRLYFWFKFIYTANLQVYCLALLGLQNMHAGIAIEQNWRWLVIRCRHWKKRGKKKEKRHYRLERSSVHKVLSKHEDLSSSSRTQILMTTTMMMMTHQTEWCTLQRERLADCWCLLASKPHKSVNFNPN